MVGDSYTSQGYNRQRIGTNSVLGRLHAVNQMEQLICITMYNEKKTEFLATMKGIMVDVNRMVRNGRIKTPHT